MGEVIRLTKPGYLIRCLCGHCGHEHYDTVRRVEKTANIRCYVCQKYTCKVVSVKAIRQDVGEDERR